MGEEGYGRGRIWERKDMGDVSPVGQGRAQRVAEDTWPRIRRLFSSPDNALTKARAE